MSDSTRDRRALIVGTAGHVDHGKTALVRALTGVDTDRWEEEKTRGLTIDLGFAPLDLDPELEVGVVDVPGHEDFVKNMLAGATGVDVLLLLVAADEGPMPQTREHLDIATLLGVRAGVVALNKVDRVEEEWLELARDAVAEALRATGVPEVEAWPVIPVSARDGEGLDALRDALAEQARRAPERPTGDRFRMPVDRSFSLPGAGTVATGTTWSGTVRTGDVLRILPGGEEVRVRSVEVHGRGRDLVGPGRRCGLALVGVDPDGVPRGSVLVDGAAWSSATALGARLRVLPHVRRSMQDGQRVRVHLGTREVMARVRLERETPLPPGGEDWARLDLEDPLVARTGDRFVVRFYSPVVTIGGGRVAETDPPHDWRERRGDWRDVLEGPPSEALSALVRLAGPRGLTHDELSVRAPPRARAAMSGSEESPPEAVTAGGRWFPRDVATSLEECLLEELERMHRHRPRAAAASLQALRAAVAEDVHRALVERALTRLEERGEIVVSGGEARRPEHRPTLSPEERRLSDALRERIRGGGTEPPTVEELQDTVGGDAQLLHDLLDLLVDAGELVEVSPDLYVDPAVEEEVRRGVTSLLRERGAPVAAGDFREGLGDVSRKYLIAYLEYLDRTGLTKRTPEGRVLAGDA